MSDETTQQRAQGVQAVIMAAGKGTRMKSARVKVLHEVLGRPMIGHVIRGARAAGVGEIVAVLGHDRERVEAWLAEHVVEAPVRCAVQHEQLGTGHAVFAAREALEIGPSHTLILSGDVPNMTAATLKAFIDAALEVDATLALMTATLDDAASYGRVLRDGAGAVCGIVEFKDADEAQRAVREINAGVYLAQTDFLLSELAALCARPPENAQGEYYLTDLVARAYEVGRTLGWSLQDVREVQGVNSRADMARVTAMMRDRINAAWMAEGVTFLDPSRAFVEDGVVLARDVVIYPDVHLEGDTRVDEGAVIEAGCTVRDSYIGPECVLKRGSYIEGSTVGASCSLGPFVHLRPGSVVGQGCKLGNFVEVKKSTLGDGVKAGHLAYLGDAIIGPDVNVGAGTITCNYDGARKHPTHIGEGAFIGTNASLVAPVTIGKGAYVGAGSTITQDVPDEALALGRGRQRNIEGWATRPHPRVAPATPPLSREPGEG